MKKVALYCTLFLAAAALYVPAQAQGKKEDKKKEAAPLSPRATASNDFAEISYGQPSKRGRQIFGSLVPYGEVWRTGANMSTDITFKTDVLFGGQQVKKGTYALFTIPAEGEWTVILNSQPKQRGASEYEANRSKNVVEVKVPAEVQQTVEEKLTIGFEENLLVIKWDNVRVAVPLQKK